MEVLTPILMVLYTACPLYDFRGAGSLWKGIKNARMMLANDIVSACAYVRNTHVLLEVFNCPAFLNYPSSICKYTDMNVVKYVAIEIYPHRISLFSFQVGEDMENAKEALRFER